MSGVSDGCDACLSGVAACCSAISACEADTVCNACLSDGSGSACATDMDLTTLNTACPTSSGTCQTACTLLNSCNPVTNVDCVAADGAGAVCDAAGDGTYACFEGTDNTVPLCGSCDGSTTFCAAGLTCLLDGDGNGQCAAYCCTNADCGSSGFCDTTLVGGVGGGLCTLAPPQDGGVTDAALPDATTQDATIAQDAAPADAGVMADGGGVTGPSLVCSGIPTTPPSGGSCVTFSPDAGM